VTGSLENKNLEDPKTFFLGIIIIKKMFIGMRKTL